MLSVQPKISTNYKPVFKANYEFDNNEELLNNLYENDTQDFDFKSEDSYNRARREIEDTKRDFEDIYNDAEAKLPKPAKTIIKGGAVITTGLLGGMATGWGTKKTIQGFSKLANTEFVKGLKSQVKLTNKFIKETAKDINIKFKKSDAYKEPLAKIDSFAKTKVGGPVVKFLKSVGNGIKFVYKTVASAINFIYKKITGVKKSTYEKATVNFVGVSGGIASGVTALKEKSEE